MINFMKKKKMSKKFEKLVKEAIDKGCDYLSPEPKWTVHPDGSRTRPFIGYLRKKGE